MKPSRHVTADDAAATGLPEPARPEPTLPAAAERNPATGLRHRHDGWTAQRQRLFVATLANTGSVAEAARTAGITARSAYRLRNDPRGAAFARAWEAALLTAASRLTAIAFDRAITGSPRRLWRDGELVATQTVPSDQMLMFLLRHLQPRLFAADADIRVMERMQAGYGDAVAALADAPVDCDLLDPADIVLNASGHGGSPHPL